MGEALCSLNQVTSFIYKCRLVFVILCSGKEQLLGTIIPFLSWYSDFINNSEFNSFEAEVKDSSKWTQHYLCCSNLLNWITNRYKEGYILVPFRQCSLFSFHKIEKDFITWKVYKSAIIYSFSLPRNSYYSSSWYYTAVLVLRASIAYAVFGVYSVVIAIHPVEADGYAMSHTLNWKHIYCCLRIYAT